MSHAKQCPQCGQINAAENTVCVICQTPLPVDATPVIVQPSSFVRPSAASKREREEIISMYMRWCNYTTWRGYVPLLLGLVFFCGSMSKDSVAPAISGLAALAGAGIVYGGPKVRKGLQVGETWSYDIVILAHRIIYVVLILMIIGLTWLGLSDPHEPPPWVAVAILFLIPITGLIINWYAHRAFEVVVGRRAGKMRRFGPLSDTGGRPAGIKAYTYFMGLYTILSIGILIATGHSSLKEHPDSFRGIAGVVLLGVPLVALPIILGIGVWQRRAWGRQLALIVHAVIGVMILFVLLPSHGPAEIPPSFIGGFIWNLIIWLWFNNHPQYFDR